MIAVNDLLFRNLLIIKKIAIIMKSIESPDVKLSIRQTEEGEDDIIRNGGNTSKFFLQQQEAPLFRVIYALKHIIIKPEFGDHQQLWELMGQYLGRDVSSIQKSIVGHVEYTLAMTRFNFSNFVTLVISLSNVYRAACKQWHFR